jgi:hypothetical protein
MKSRRRRGKNLRGDFAGMINGEVVTIDGERLTEEDWQSLKPRRRKSAEPR